MGACGTLRYAFYMGYRYALSIIEEVAPLGSTLELIGKTLMTEHELGFTQTRLEQERQEQNEMPGAGKREHFCFLCKVPHHARSAEQCETTSRERVVSGKRI